MRPAQSYFTRPVVEPAPETVSYKGFWTGARRLPPAIEAPPAPSVPALLIRKEATIPPSGRRISPSSRSWKSSTSASAPGARR